MTGRKGLTAWVRIAILYLHALPLVYVQLPQIVLLQPRLLDVTHHSSYNSTEGSVGLDLVATVYLHVLP